MEIYDLLVNYNLTRWIPSIKLEVLDVWDADCGVIQVFLANP